MSYEGNRAVAINPKVGHQICRSGYTRVVDLARIQTSIRWEFASHLTLGEAIILHPLVKAETNPCPSGGCEIMGIWVPTAVEIELSSAKFQERGRGFSQPPWLDERWGRGCKRGFVWRFRQ